MTERSKVKLEPPDDCDDALSTLAAAAISRDSMPLAKKEPVCYSLSNGSSSPADSIEPLWYDVGIIKRTSCVVSDFYLTEKTVDHSSDTSEYIPDYRNLSKFSLLPGKVYKFRVAALNTCGIGEWSDVSAFKTCLPGFPGTPCSIHISKSSEGASLKWDSPTLRYGKIIEYSVCLAIKTDACMTGNVSLKDLPFVRVYCGAENYAFVEDSSLKAAFIDKSVKPAIIFRIAARNEKGYGPATQVRWLQDFPGAESNL